MLKAPLDKEGRRSYGNGSGTGDYYIVEARSTYGQPQIVTAGVTPMLSFVLDAEWRRIPTNGDSEFQVPVRVFHTEAQESGLLSYEAASAIAHLFIAVLEAQFSAGCVEVRLVKVHFERSYKTWEVGVGEIINRTDGPRPNFTARETEDIPFSAREDRANNANKVHEPARDAENVASN